VTHPADTPKPPSPGAPGLRQTRAIVGCFALLLVALHLVVGPLIKPADWRLDPRSNASFAEAVAWRAGRLDLELPQRIHDTALYEGRLYNVIPPLFTVMSYAAITAAGALGLPSGEFYSPWFFGLVALPLPFVAFAVFQQVMRRPPWAALLTFACIAGTPVLPSLVAAESGGINHVNHLLSQTGLFIVLLALIDGRYLRWALFGLFIAAWSRPTTIFFAAPILWTAWSADARLRRRRCIASLLTLAVIVGVPMALSAAKFGSPFETGYRYLYEGRSDELALRGTDGVFSTRFVATNAWYMNVEPGRIVSGGAWGWRPQFDPYGGSIWLSMPLLLLMWPDLRHWWRSPLDRVLLLSSLAVIAALLCFHNTGYLQPGYYRYALDFLPVWLALIASRLLVGPARQRFALGAIAWSLLYFNTAATMYA
jgi:hypothetical protein